MPNPMGDLTRLLRWTTRGTNCSVCDRLEGRVYTYDRWMSSGVWPGFHRNCDCYLKIVSDPAIEESDPDIFGTDLSLYLDIYNIDSPLFRFHWDPNYTPFSWYITEEINTAALSYGKGLSIGQVLNS